MTFGNAENKVNFFYDFSYTFCRWWSAPIHGTNSSSKNCRLMCAQKQTQKRTESYKGSSLSLVEDFLKLSIHRNETLLLTVHFNLIKTTKFEVLLLKFFRKQICSFLLDYEFFDFLKKRENVD
jgi:hypothetical protein